MAEARPKKRCYFMSNNIQHIDYKDAAFLKRFLSDRGKILPRRITGISMFFQNKLKTAIKRARAAGILPYVLD
ncbi:MAG: 30S ribosomal protein S18 [Vampirovibrionales bacterium]|nr:30S ribosomal protein S18 [Vampirovibrionales bacterium]